MQITVNARIWSSPSPTTDISPPGACGFVVDMTQGRDQVVTAAGVQGGDDHHVLQVTIPPPGQRRLRGQIQSGNHEQHQPRTEFVRGADRDQRLAGARRRHEQTPRPRAPQIPCQPHDGLDLVGKELRGPGPAGARQFRHSHVSSSFESVAPVVAAGQFDPHIGRSGHGTAVARAQACEGAGVGDGVVLVEVGGQHLLGSVVLVRSSAGVQV